MVCESVNSRISLDWIQHVNYIVSRERTFWFKIFFFHFLCRKDSFPLILRQSFEHFHFFAEKGLLSDKNGIMCKVSVAPAPAVARANETVR